MTYQPGQWERSIAGGQNAYVVWRHYFMLDGLVGMMSVTALLSADHNLENGRSQLLYSLRLARKQEQHFENVYNQSIDDLIPRLRVASIKTAKTMIQKWLRFIGDRFTELSKLEPYWQSKERDVVYEVIYRCLYQPDITVVTYGRTDEERNISAMLASPDPKSVALAYELCANQGIDYKEVYPMQVKDYDGWQVLQTLYPHTCTEEDSVRPIDWVWHLIT